MAERKNPFMSMRKLKRAGVAASAFVAVSVPGLTIQNAIESGAEFNALNNMARVAIENGELTAEDGTPRTHEIEYNGQKFTIVIEAAYMQQSGQFTDMEGTSASSTSSTTDVQGVGLQSSRTYSANYVVRGQLYRTQSSDALHRVFYDDGGSRAFEFTWLGTTPTYAPLSRQTIVDVDTRVRQVIPEPNGN